MADKISIEIGLEGGEEVTRQLADMGKAGEKAFSDIQGAAEQVNLNSATAQFDDLGNAGQAAFQKVQSAAQNAVVFEKVIQGIKKVEGAFKSLGTAATKMATRMTRSLGVFGVLARSFGPVGIAAGVAAGAILKFGNDSSKALSELNVEGAKLGLTAQKFDTLQKALTSLGVAPGSITGGLEKLKETLSQGFFSQDIITGLQQFITTLERMPDGVERTQLAIKTLGDELGGQVIAGLQTGAISAQNYAAALNSVRPATQQQIIDAAKYEQALNRLGAAWTRVKAAFTPIATPLFDLLAWQLEGVKKGIQTTILEFMRFKMFFDVFMAGIKGEDVGAAAKKAAEAYKKLKEEMAETGQQASQSFGGITSAANDTAAAATQAGTDMKDANTGAGDSARNTSNQIRQLEADYIRLGSTAERVKQFLAFPQDPMTGQRNIDAYDPANYFASGGLLGGRGTGTSDSNLAWVSRGEYITPARAVQQPGVLSFLEALRHSGGNLSRVLDGMGRFALGGLVPRMPAFAAGGLAGGSNVTIQFPGLPPIGGLRASSDVVEQLHRAAALAQVRSGGRKPSRYA